LNQFFREVEFGLITNREEIVWIKIIGDQKLLMTTASRAFVLKVFVASTCQFPIGAFHSIMDQLNKGNFALYYRNGLIMGRVIGDQIVLDKPKKYACPSFCPFPENFWST
jgi:hypothetical protein